MAVNTQNSSALTQEQVQKVLVQPLEKKSAFLAAVPAANIFNSNGSPVRVPKLPSPTSPDWIAENEQITEKNPQFTEITLLPSNMKSVKVITRFSNELARQSVVSLDQALRTRLVRDVAGVLDNELWNGEGETDANGNITPTGLFNYDGIQEIDAVGNPDLDDLHDAVGMALGAEVDPESGLRWVMTSRDFVNLRKLKDGDDRYQLTPDPTQRGGYTLLGYPVTITNRLKVTAGVSEIGLVDFGQIAVARDLAPAVTLLTERYADYDQQALRVVTRYDAAPMNEDAVVVLRGVTSPAAV